MVRFWASWLVIGLLCRTVIGPDEPPLLDQLLSSVGIGDATCKKVGKLARAALRPATPALRDAARSISNGNAERDLHSWASRQIWRRLVPDPYDFRLIVNRWSGDEEPCERTRSCLLPHEVFATIYKHGPELFDELFIGGLANLRDWWREAERIGGTWFSQHPVIRNFPDPLSRIPIGIHGDDAGVHGQEQVLVLTWCSVAHQKPTLDSRIVFTMVKVADIVHPITLHTVYSVLTWSLEALATGQYPFRDHLGNLFTEETDPRRFKLAGKLLAGGVVAAWAEMRGDWKYLREALHLKEHYGLPLRICHLCLVQKFSRFPNMRYTDFRQAGTL